MSAKKKAPRLKLTDMEQQFVSHKIELLVKEGKTQQQAAGEAYGMVRQARKKRGKRHA